MKLIILGANYNSASLDTREVLARRLQNSDAVYKELMQILGVEEVIVLSTCNRSELYIIADDEGADHVSSWFTALNPNDSQSWLYQHEAADAIRHCLRVAAGLDSMVLGEAEILGQMKNAYVNAQAERSVGPKLHRLFQYGFSTAKQVKTQTGLSQKARSVVGLGLNLLQRVFTDFEKHSALLIGAGETVQLLAERLHQRGLKRMIVANRSLSHAQTLAQRFNAFAIPLDQIQHHLYEADIVASGTASPAHMVTVNAMEKALHQRHNRPVAVLDLAVPRDIEPGVEQLRSVYAFGVDDLQALATQHKSELHQEAEQARYIVEEAVRGFLAPESVEEIAPLMQSLKSRGDDIVEAALDEARRSIAQGKDIDQVLEKLARRIHNQLMHAPHRELKQASERGDQTLIEGAKKLLNL